MSKFDAIYERLDFELRERHYIDSTFEDNMRSLVKTLKDNDYLAADKDVEHYVHEIMNQPKNVKEVVLDTQENSLPAMKLHVKQENDTESFSVTVINLDKPDEQKEFTNSMLETVFDDVVEYIKTTALQGLKPEAGVEELPQAEGPNAQPGGGESALPTGEQPAAEEGQQKV